MLNHNTVNCSRRCFEAALLVAGGLILFPAAFGQNAPGLRQGTTELGAFAGASFGADAFRVMGGGNVSYAVNNFILPYAEFSYFPGLPRDKSPTGASTLTYDLPLADFHAGVHIGIPFAERRLVPYFVFGVGSIHNFQANYDLNVTDQFGNVTKTPEIRPAANSFALNFGFGVRYYIDQRWGVRVEGKAYKAFGQINDIFSKYEFGVFYQFHR